MEFALTLFDLVLDGLAGRRWKRWVARCLGLLVIGLAVGLGAAEWLFGQYIEHQTSVAEKLLQDVLDAVQDSSAQVER